MFRFASDLPDFCCEPVQHFIVRLNHYRLTVQSLRKTRGGSDADAVFPHELGQPGVISQHDALDRVGALTQ